jgi:hypothetical protein
MIGSGMGHGPGDNFIVINVDTNKEISYDLICLNDTNLFCFGELSDYIISIGLEENIATHSSIGAYPNPVDNILTITLSENKVYSIQLFNSIGQIVFSKEKIKDSELIMDVSSYPSGIYYLSVTNDINRDIIKVIVN